VRLQTLNLCDYTSARLLTILMPSTLCRYQDGLAIEIYFLVIQASPLPPKSNDQL
jgi:hypothetical protein